MSDTFHVDATEVVRWGRKASAEWAPISRDEFRRGLHRAGHRVRNAGNRRINRWSGELQDTSYVKTDALTSRIVWPAKHAVYVDQGRGPIEAGPGRMLRFQLRSGQVLFRKRVGPARAQRFAAGGLRDARPGIRAELDEASRRAVRRFEAL